MRPFNLLFQLLISPCSDSGLINNGKVEYHQQKMPVEVCSCGAGSDAPTNLDAEVEHQLPERDVSNQESAEEARPQSTAESRAQRLQRIRNEIAAGVYETSEKLEAAVDRMLGVLIDS